MKNTLIITGIILSLMLAGCDQPADTTDENLDNKAVVEESEKNTENTEEKEETKTPKINTELGSYFQESDVEFGDINKLDVSNILGDKIEEIQKNETINTPYRLELEYMEWYEVGEIKVEPYKEYKLVILDLQCEGMCFRNNTYRFAWNKENQELILLEKHSDDVETEELFEVIASKRDKTTNLNNLDLPEEITMPDGKNTIQLEVKDSHYTLDNFSDNIEVAFENEKYGTLYKYTEDIGTGCLYLMGPDGSVSTYKYDPYFFDAGEVMINWNDNSAPTSLPDTYATVHRGCGISGNCYFVEKVTEKELTKVGYTSHNKDLYIVADPLEGASTETTSTAVQKQLDMHYASYKSMINISNKTTTEEKETPISFENFLKETPLLYWQDPLGRWSAIVNQDFVQPAECGKPVIYLYPEETTDVHVEVDIDKFTVTIPDYGTNGWTVSAQPNGQLLNYADGETYPYLFWEGYKKDSVSSNKGFVIKRDEIKSFLNDSLTKTGLNAQEKADFMEFWYPRMMKNPEPYFFISFVGTKEFNKVAPLTIEPQPETLIRVFMYYDPIYVPFHAEKQELKSIPRNGFTVIEWGGTSSKPWQY